MPELREATLGSWRDPPADREPAANSRSTWEHLENLEQQHGEEVSHACQAGPGQHPGGPGPESLQPEDCRSIVHGPRAPGRAGRTVSVELTPGWEQDRVHRANTRPCRPEAPTLTRCQGVWAVSEAEGCSFLYHRTTSWASPNRHCHSSL